MSKNAQTLQKEIINLCTKLGITGGRTKVHPQSVGVTFIATQVQWSKFYDVVTGSDLIIDNPTFKKIENPGDPPSYFYDLTVKW